MLLQFDYSLGDFLLSSNVKIEKVEFKAFYDIVPITKIHTWSAAMSYTMAISVEVNIVKENILIEFGTTKEKLSVRLNADRY